MKHSIVIALILMQTSLGIYSQNGKELEDLFDHRAFFLEQNQVEYAQPSGFDFVKRELNNAEFLKCIYADTCAMYQSYCYKIISNDKNFLIVIDIPPVYSKDSIYVYMELTQDLNVNINTYHLDHIEGDFWINTRDEDLSLENLPIKYKSSEYAHEAFNADTVITYPLKMWQKYENKYNYCQAIMIQKNGSGPICLYCFYNDKGKKRLRSYLKSLEGMFWYQDSKKYIVNSKSGQ